MGLKHSIDWGKYDMTVIADKSDGLSALDSFREVRPDLVITDIRMPGLNGMDLIREIKKIDGTCVVIILSCLEEFDLARQAIQLGVSMYLLKATMTEEETGQALAHAKTILDARTRTDVTTEDPAIQSTLQEELVRNYLICCVLPKHAFNNRAVSLGIGFLLSSVFMVLMEIDRFNPSGQTMAPLEGHTILQSVKNIAQEKVASFGRHCLVQVDERHLLMLIEGDESRKEPLAVVLQDIRTALESYFGLSVSFSMLYSGEEGTDLTDIYIQCNKLLHLKYIYGNGRILDRHSYRELSMQLESNMKPLSCTIDENYQSSAEARGILSAVTKEIEPLAAEGKAAVQMKLLQMMKAFLPQNRDLLTKETTDLNKELASSNTMMEAVLSIDSYLQQCFAYGLKSKRDDIRKAVSIVREEYMRDLTMHAVAARVGLSPNYFSSLFQQETGHHFLSFLHMTRINEAKELLRDTRLYFYEIAERTGFTDETYFSRLFKRETGMSPSEWRCRFHEQDT
jgi:YesN/AraC family two-component response regulator